MSTRIFEDGTIVAGPLRPCEEHYGPHGYHGLDCATPAEWDAASAAFREGQARPRPRSRRWAIWKSLRFKGQWVTRTPEGAVFYHPTHEAALQFVAAHLRQEVTG